MLDVFEILEPDTAAEAAGMLRAYGDAAAIYAGGTELLLIMKEGLAHFPYLVNLKTVAGLDHIQLSADAARLEIGALARHSQIEQSHTIRRHAPLLAEMERTVANPRVRAAGTLGGNLCFAEPHSDPATLLLAWGAQVELAAPDGLRHLPLSEFLLGPLETARRPDELLTQVHLPLLPQGMAGAYLKFTSHERPTATVAALLLMEAGLIREARIAAGSVGPRPLRASAAEALLHGSPPSAEAFGAAAASAAQAVEPSDDLYGSAEYKRHLIKVLTHQALDQALQRASVNDSN